MDLVLSEKSSDDDDGLNAGLLLIPIGGDNTRTEFFELTKSIIKMFMGSRNESLFQGCWYQPHGPIASKWVLIRTSMVAGFGNGMMLLKGYQRSIILSTISLDVETLQSFQDMQVLLCPILGRNLIEKAILKASFSDMVGDFPY